MWPAMGKFRKRPAVVEAVQYTGSNWDEVHAWVKERSPGMSSALLSFDHVIKINTLEGVMDVPPGWWVIRGVKGEFYPCANDIFEATYESVDDAPLTQMR